MAVVICRVKKILRKNFLEKNEGSMIEKNVRKILSSILKKLKTQNQKNGSFLSPKTHTMFFSTIDVMKVLLIFFLNLIFLWTMFQMVITTLQLIQMVVGCYINIWAYNYINSLPTALDHRQHFCHISKLNIKLSMAMYFSYFVLFARFFYKNYIGYGHNGKEHSATGFRMVGNGKSLSNGINNELKSKTH